MRNGIVKIPFVLWYFSGLLIGLGALWYLAGALHVFLPEALNNFHFAYRDQIIGTIPLLIPSLFGYFTIRIVDFFLFRKKTIGIETATTKLSLSKIGLRTLENGFHFLSAFSVTFLIWGVYFAFIYMVGWKIVGNFQRGGMNLVDQLVKCLFTSIREEFMFRFFLMSALAYGIGLVASKKISIAVSLIIISVMFGLSHFFVIQQRPFSWYTLALDVVAGLVLGQAFILTKSLYFSIGFHLGWNFFLGAIPILGNFTIHNLPEWSSILVILIILFIMVPFYYFSRSFLR